MHFWEPRTLQSHGTAWRRFAEDIRTAERITSLPGTWSAWTGALERYLDRQFVALKEGELASVQEVLKTATTVRVVADRLQLREDVHSRGGAETRWTVATSLQKALFSQRPLVLQEQPLEADARRVPQTVYDARRVLLLWAARADNDDLPIADLRDKVIALLGADSAARVSSLDGTMRDRISFRDLGWCVQMTCAVWSGKGNNARWQNTAPIHSFPQWPKICTVEAVQCYMRRTEHEAGRVAYNVRVALEESDDWRTGGRGNSGRGTPLFIFLAPRDPGGSPEDITRYYASLARARALQPATIRRRIEVVTSALEAPEPTAHRLRHSVGSTLHHLGVSEQEIVLACGWKDVATFHRYYRHPIANPLTEAEVARAPRDRRARVVEVPAGLATPLSWRLRSIFIAEVGRRAAAPVEDLGPPPARRRRL